MAPNTGGRAGPGNKGKSHFASPPSVPLNILQEHILARLRAGLGGPSQSGPVQKGGLARESGQEMGLLGTTVFREPYTSNLEECGSYTD